MNTHQNSRPSEISSWIDLAPWSNLKHPKKWMRNNRLCKKFCKFWYRYLAETIWLRYHTRQELMIEAKYQEALEEIMKKEDRIYGL